MEKKELIKLMDSFLKPYCFKKKGNYWRIEGDELIKIVNQQKSQWGNQFYINYGYNIKNLEYDGANMHIFRGVNTNDANGKNILDFELSLSGDRNKMIEGLLMNSILTEFDQINTVVELVEDLKKQPQLNSVPLKVKEFLGLTAN